MSLFEPNEINGKYQKTTLKLDESGNSSTGSDDGFEYIGGSENALHDQKTLLKIITENKRLTRELEELKLDMKELKQSNGQLIGRNLIEDRIAADSTDKSKEASKITVFQDNTMEQHCDTMKSILEQLANCNCGRCPHCASFRTLIHQCKNYGQQDVCPVCMQQIRSVNIEIDRPPPPQPDGVSSPVVDSYTESIYSLSKGLEQQLKISPSNEIYEAMKFGELPLASKGVNPINGGNNSRSPSDEILNNVKRYVKIQKREGYLIGLSIRGGVDDEKPVVISHIFPQSPAAELMSRGELFVGDVILAVDGESLINATHSEAVKAMTQTSKSVMTLCVQHNKELSDGFLKRTKERKQLIVEQHCSADDRKLFVPNGLYAIYSVNPAGGVQSIDLFQSNGRLTVSEENEIVPSFVQITNQTKNGKQFVSMCWPGSESECFLTSFLCEDNFVRSCFCLSPSETTDETMYELFAPMIRFAGNKDEQFELMIWSVQHKTFVVAEITKAQQQQHPTNRTLFILKPCSYILRTLKTHVPPTICQIRIAGTNAQLVIGQNNTLAFTCAATRSSGDVFCPIWNDAEGSFCLFLPDKSCDIGTNNCLATLVATAEETKKVKFWVHRLYEDGSLALWHGFSNSHAEMKYVDTTSNVCRMLLKFDTLS